MDDSLHLEPLRSERALRRRGEHDVLAVAGLDALAETVDHGDVRLLVGCEDMLV